MDAPTTPTIGSRWTVNGRDVITVTGAPRWSPALKLWFVTGTLKRWYPDGRQVRGRAGKVVCHCDDFKRMAELPKEASYAKI